MHNNNLTWLWEEVDILMPTIYTPTNGTPGSTGSAGIAARVRGLFTEAERLINLVSSARAAKGRPDLEIVPWVWERYDNNPKTFLSEQDLKSLFAVPFEFPHTGTLMLYCALFLNLIRCLRTAALLKWGDPAIGHVTVSQLQKNFDERLGQFITDTVEDLCACAKSHCSGHGRCFTWTKPPPAPPAPVPPSPRPGPQPVGCEALLHALFGPTARDHGCRPPTSQSKCSECTVGEHGDALRRAGCSASQETQFCKNASVTTTRTGALNPHADSAAGPYCYCDRGWSGADCSTRDEATARDKPLIGPRTSDVSADDTTRGDSVMCTDGITSCPANTSCGQFVTGLFGCCPLPSATICDYQDGPWCCPQGYSCDLDARVCFKE